MVAGVRVGGLARWSSCDMPGRLAATVFLRGCPWRCRYCHNRHLLCAEGEEIAWDEVLGFLRTRARLLDAVVFSGGEPTVSVGLADAMTETRDLGFEIGLHTGGPAPERLSAVLPLVEWVGFDVKAPFEDYETVVGFPGAGARARASLRLVLDSGREVEVRTTLHPALIDPEAAERLGKSLLDEGVRRWTLQAYRPVGVDDGELGAARISLDPYRARLEGLGFDALTFRTN